MKEPYSWFQTANYRRKISPNWIALRKDYRKFEKRTKQHLTRSQGTVLVSLERGSDGSFVFTSVGAQSMAFSSHSEFRVTHFGTPTGNAVLETCISMKKEDKKEQTGAEDLRWKENSSSTFYRLFSCFNSRFPFIYVSAFSTWGSNSLS